MPQHPPHFRRDSLPVFEKRERVRGGSKEVENLRRPLPGFQREVRALPSSFYRLRPGMLEDRPQLHLDGTLVSDQLQVDCAVAGIRSEEHTSELQSRQY